MPVFEEGASANMLALLVVLFILKQYLADFILQNSWMAKGKDEETAWQAPLLAHAGIHSLATLAICLSFEPSMAWLASVDFVVHALVDRSKSRLQHRLRLRADTAGYWWLFGADQTLHHLTHLAFAVGITLALSQQG